MLGQIYRKNFAKFELKKRTKLGDKAFLEKYTRSFKQTNKAMKILLPILLVLNTVNAVGWIVLFATNPYDAYKLTMMVFWIIIALGWTFIAFVYYTHHIKFHAEKIKAWTEELNTMIREEKTPLESNTPVD